MVKAFHYTTPEAYRSMHNGRNWGKKGLLPLKRFIKMSRAPTNLPDKATENVIEGLLEPEPKYWTKNKEFPGLWYYLMHDICRKEKIMLLSFDLTKKDKAYIVERAHMERELYRDSKRQGPSTTRTMHKACEKYWESRVPAFDYDGGYTVPQLAIWKPIPFKRLNIEWIKPHDEVWEEVLKKDPRSN